MQTPPGPQSARPAPSPLRADRHVLGVDVGGSSAKIVVVAQDADGRLGEPVHRHRWPMPADADLASLVAALVAASDEYAVSAVGLSVPGVVDPSGAHVVRSANVPWLEDRTLLTTLAGALGAPVTLVNDGEAFATAEALLGAGSRHDDVLVLALGTGVAGSHVVHGRVRRGAHGAAGELGHVVIDPTGDPCACGQRGCLETWIGAPHLVRRWAMAGGPADGTPASLADAVRAGDATAGAVVAEIHRALARALLHVVTLVDPGLVVVGGGVGLAADVYVQPAVGLAREWATFQTVPLVLGAELGAWAGARGAALAGGATTP